MKYIQYPNQADWQILLKRPTLDNDTLETSVKTILQAVRQNGDEALQYYTEALDGAKLEQFAVTEAEFAEAATQISDELKNAIAIAQENIRVFHSSQKQAPQVIETMKGVQCWRKNVAIERVGLYIPGGTAPLFSSILMLGVPAKIAGCSRIVLCTPPNKEGKVNPAILYTAQAVGVTEIYKLGGAQAIGALAYGTATVPKVDKIFGPGNQYVTCAKQLVAQQGVAIDMPAGPSEVAVLADNTAQADFVAADLLSQAEHGADSQVILVSTDEQLIKDSLAAVERQVETLTRREIAKQALQHSKAILVKDMETAIEMINAYAPEHLILACDACDTIAERITNAGSVFIGHFTPESAGDYASGTNHTLPTNGYARAYSGVSLDAFVKKITFQKISREGLANLSPAIEPMALAEQLDAHQKAVRIRLEAKL